MTRTLLVCVLMAVGCGGVENEPLAPAKYVLKDVCRDTRYMNWHLTLHPAANTESAGPVIIALSTDSDLVTRQPNRQEEIHITTAQSMSDEFTVSVNTWCETCSGVTPTSHFEQRITDAVDCD